MKHLTLFAALTFAFTVPVRAQTYDEQSAYRALIYTPLAGFAPLPPSIDSLGSRAGSRATLHGRVGRMTRGGGLSLTSVGVGVELPVNDWLLGGTLGYISASCGVEWAGDSDCAGDIMVGGSARRTLTSKPLGERQSRGRRARSNDGHLVVGLEGSAGFSPRQGEQAMAVAAALPTSLVFPSGNIRIMPFLTPSLAYGRMGNTAYFDEAPTSYGSFTYLLGGGLGLQFGRSGLTAALGFQKVFKSEGGATQLGLSMTWRGVTSR